MENRKSWSFKSLEEYMNLLREQNRTEKKHEKAGRMARGATDTTHSCPKVLTTSPSRFF